MHPDKINFLSLKALNLILPRTGSVIKNEIQLGLIILIIIKHKINKDNKISIQIISIILIQVLQW